MTHKSEKTNKSSVSGKFDPLTFHNLNTRGFRSNENKSSQIFLQASTKSFDKN